MTEARGVSRALIVAALSLCTTCEPHRAAAPAAALDGVASCDYDVEVTGDEPLLLVVTARCQGRGVRGLEADSELIADAVANVESDRGKTQRRSEAFLLSEPAGAATFRYQIDLDRLAQLKPDIDIAFRSGRSLLAPGSSFLLYPLPLDVGIGVRVRVKTPPGVDFATGLEREGDHFKLEAHEIPVATYSAFGTLGRAKFALDGGKSEIELVVLDGELAVSLETLAQFAEARARAVAEFYGGFPAPHSVLTVVPIKGRDEVVFGKLLPESAPGVVLLVGSRATQAALHDDWVLVHEFFHIGVPSFFREGKWFDEGLATYFEPIIRVRAGLLDPTAAWREFALEMPRALTALTRDGLEHTQSYTGMYWGGAIFCLLADIEARSRSRGRVGLEDGIRRAHAAGGHAWDVWTLDKTLRSADHAFSEPILARLAARYSNHPEALDIEATFRELGISRTGAGVVVSEQAPLAWVRHAIFDGKAPTTLPNP